MVKHFIDINDLSKEEILEIISLARKFKEAKKENAVPRLLEGKSLAMIFELPSSRTRVSFENAIVLLGGHAIYLKPGEIHLGSREILKDTAKVLSGLCDFILMRSWEHSSLLELARYSSVPVFNALTDYNHPTQALADMLTIMENTNKDLDSLVVTFVGDRTNVCHSLLNICVKLDIEFRQIAPKKFQIQRSILNRTLINNPYYNNEVIISDQVQQLGNSDFVYTDLWWWINQEVEKEVRIEAFLDKYQVDVDLLRKTKNPNIKFMHCLPANRGMEVTSDVLDNESSLAFNQSENRLFIQMALLTYYNNKSMEGASKDTKEKHQKNIEGQLKKMANLS